MTQKAVKISILLNWHNFDEELGIKLFLKNSKIYINETY